MGTFTEAEEAEGRAHSQKQNREEAEAKAEMKSREEKKQIVRMNYTDVLRGMITIPLLLSPTFHLTTFITRITRDNFFAAVSSQLRKASALASRSRFH